MPSQQMTPSKRLLIRSGLVTGSTLAALMGAQILATLDQPNSDTETVQEIIPITPGFANSSANPTLNAAPLRPTTVNTPVAAKAAPNIVILRHPGQPTISTEDTASPTTMPQVAAQIVMQPPNPVAIAQPAPVIIQGEAPPPVIVQVQGSSSSSSSPRSRSS